MDTSQHTAQVIVVLGGVTSLTDSIKTVIVIYHPGGPQQAINLVGSCMNCCKS